MIRTDFKRITLSKYAVIDQVISKCKRKCYTNVLDNHDDWLERSFTRKKNKVDQRDIGPPHLCEKVHKNDDSSYHKIFLIEYKKIEFRRR